MTTDPPALTLAAVRAQLTGYDPETLAAWKVALNVFTWPEECPVQCPPGFAEADTVERMRLVQPLWVVLSEQVSEEDFSQAWWVLGLGRTEAAWQEWWDTGGETFCDELRKDWRL